MQTLIIIIIMDICKAPTLRLKTLNKHSHIMYIEMERWEMLLRGDTCTRWEMLLSGAYMHTLGDVVEGGYMHTLGDVVEGGYMHTLGDV